MKKETVIGLAGFNLLFAAAEIILFSALRDSGAKPAASLLAGVISFAVFVAVNYCIFTFVGRRKPVRTSKLKDAQDYREALESWESKQNPFNNELRQAIHQLDLFYQKKTALKALLGEEDKAENPFLSVSSDVQDFLFSNMKKLLNRMTIMDMADHSRIPMHNEYIQHILSQNKQLLSQYDNLIIEISQIGDSKDLGSLDLENITEALRELRDEQHPESGTVQQSAQEEA